ncbi:MAG: hypothetical protein CVU89_01970 [Firmicutes bacterium HGW-Firmicutes-14]|nr:MAG: hypothetical protein CVU89_01970 [Firmicutes bacterium HGW-Firmicutes-14]
MGNSIWIYRIYDITEEIDLRRVEEKLSPDKPTSRLRLSRVRPKSIHIDNPPVTVELGSSKTVLNGSEYHSTATARIFDLGVVSIVLKLDLDPHIKYEQLRDLSVFLYQTTDLEAIFEGFLAIIKTSLDIPDRPDGNSFVEDFSIYFFRTWDKSWNPTPILLAEKEPLSEQTVRETLKNSFSYGTGDMAIITWDSALVYDSEGSTDIPDLLEFATTQLLELRYYDTVLTRELDRMYDSIEMADKQGWWTKIRQYRRIMKNFMEIVIDITDITERIQKQITVTEDVFYARVYGSALSIFRTREWTESIQHKIQLIQRTYSMLNDEVVNYRSLLVELAIVGLIVFEVILTLIEY